MSTFNELIDFTRSTTGTYLDSVVYGDELVTNGDFATDSDWTKGSNWTLGDGVATSLGINAASAERVLSQASILTVGKTYTLSVAIDGSNVSSAFVNFYLAAPSTFIHSVAFDSSGIYVITFVATSTTLSLTTSAPGGYSGNFSIDNVSVKELTGGQVSGTPLLRTAAINEPRLEYDASGNPLGLLIEGARTNVLTRSNELLTDPWEGAAEIVESSIPSIAGGQCFKISSEDPVSDYRIQVGVASNGQTKSIWARTVSGTGTAHLLGHHSVPATLVTLTEQWQRFSLPVDDSEIGGFNFYAVDFRGSGTLSEILVFGAQLEAGAFPTSYIPTSGSTVTRGADFASLPVERFAYNQAQGSLVFYSKLFAEDNTSQFIYALSAEAGNSNNTIRLYDSGTDNRLISNIRTNAANVATFNIDSTAFDSPFKVFQSYKVNDFSAGIDGAVSGVDTGGAVPVNIKQLNFFSAQDSGSVASGHIKSIQYYPKRLSNEELQLLTQPSASPTMNLTFNGQATSTLVEGLHD